MTRNTESLRKMRQILRSEDGAVTVEFVVLLPFMIAFLGLIATASLYLALASDVQQLAHELARSALSVADEDDWCDQIETQRAPTLATSLPLLDPARVRDVACSADPDTRLLQVSVDYDTRGTLGALLGSVVGLRFDSFQRASFVQW